MTEQLFLVAHIAGRGVAVDTASVDSVVDIGEVVPVPRSPPEVRGIAALRSRVVTVIDPTVALGLSAGETTATRAVITRLDGHHYAILVDSLEDVAPFAAQPLSSGLALDGGWRAAASGIVERHGEPLLAIDLSALIPGAIARTPSGVA